jgi:hypothetical protein
MRLLRTTISILAISFCVQTQTAEASMDDLESMVVIGSIKNIGDNNGDLFAEWFDSQQNIGHIDVTQANKQEFVNIPFTGAVVMLTEANKALYEAVVYTEPLRLKLGKTFGLLPKFKGEDDNSVISRMKLSERLSYLNVE